MHADLASADVEEHALYDPSIGPQPDIEAAARAGTLLAMYASGLEYRVFVGEELPETLQKRISTTTKDVLLRVPSGKLVACGLADVGQPAKATGSLELPAGNYLVDAYELDYDWERDIAPVLVAELPEYRRERSLKPIANGLTLLGIGGLVGGGFAWSPLVLVASAIVLLAGLGLARAIASKRYVETKDAIAKRFPGLALVLRRLDDGADLAAHAGKPLSFSD
jgi:hypothetical protein